MQERTNTPEIHPITIGLSIAWINALGLGIAKAIPDALLPAEMPRPEWIDPRVYLTGIIGIQTLTIVLIAICVVLFVHRYISAFVTNIRTRIALADVAFCIFFWVAVHVAPFDVVRFRVFGIIAAVLWLIRILLVWWLKPFPQGSREEQAFRSLLTTYGAVWLTVIAIAALALPAQRMLPGPMLQQLLDVVVEAVLIVIPLAAGVIGVARIKWPPGSTERRMTEPRPEDAGSP